MVEHKIVNGQSAIVTHMDASLRPVAPEDATLVKIVFENDGSTLWLVAPLVSDQSKSKGSSG